METEVEGTHSHMLGRKVAGVGVMVGLSAANLTL